MNLPIITYLPGGEHFNPRPPVRISIPCPEWHLKGSFGQGDPNALYPKHKNILMNITLHNGDRIDSTTGNHAVHFLIKSKVELM